MATDPLIACPSCANTLGARVAGLVYVQHRGRKVLGRVLSIECDRCHATWLDESVSQFSEPVVSSAISS